MNKTYRITRQSASDEITMQRETTVHLIEASNAKQAIRRLNALGVTGNGSRTVKIETVETHVCDEESERKSYRQYISEGLADTDGYYAPVSFEAWQADYHREIGFVESHAHACTAEECNAPNHLKVKMVRVEPTNRRSKLRSVCSDCAGRVPRGALIRSAVSLKF